MLSITKQTGTPNDFYSVQIGGSTRVFEKIGGSYVATSDERGTLTETASEFIYTDAYGTEFRFSKSLVSNGEHFYEEVEAVGTEIARPDGATTTLHYRSDSVVLSNPTTTRYMIRVQSVTNNSGYQLKFDYDSDTPSSGVYGDDWFDLSRVTALNNAEEYCDPVADSCSFANVWPYLNYETQGYVENNQLLQLHTVTDVLGRETHFRTDGFNRLFAVKRPGETTDGISIQYTHSQPGARVAAVTSQGTYTRNYTWTVDGNELTSVSTDNLGRNRTVVTDLEKALVLSITNGVNQTTTFAYDSDDRLETVTAPEGNQVDYDYDARGNVTQVRRKAKTGSSEPDIVVSSTYAASCSNAVTCNLPTSTTDARGKTTDYTYNSTTGLITDIWAPADASGVRARQRFLYGNRYAKAKNSSGSLVLFANPISTITTIRQCRTASTCTGSADERVTTFGYDNNSAPNLQPVTINTKTGANTLSQTTAYTYTDLGLVETVDGPLSGTSDTTTFRYDNAGQRTGVIAPDPDGSGFIPRLASRVTYNADGQVTVSETGTVDGTSETAWNNFYVDKKFVTEYDDFGRVETSAQVAPSGTTQYSITQYSYDIAGRPECVAVRMNAPTTSTSLPASACTNMTAGSYGDDRIVKRYYDTADRVTEVWSGIGTVLAQQTAEMSYNDNGTVAWVEDAKDNRTTYTYDGHDRSYKITYPDASYEQVSYDPGGNILTHRTRRNETITYAYDNLSRVTSKTVPNRTGLSITHTRDVDYAYDLFGAMTEAKFTSPTVEGLTFSYDGLGRLISTTQDLDGVTRTLSYGYNSQGRLANITHPDSVRFNYSYYNPTGQLKTIYRHGAEAIQSFLYTNTGRLRWRGLTGGTFRQARYFDGAGRLDRLLITKWGNPNDTETTFDYNPAYQVLNEDTTNGDYVWDKHPTTDLNHTFGANNLNQISQLNSTNFSYDLNGNLTSDGSTNYIYDVENRLVSVSGSETGTLRYDPLGRLYEVTDSVGNKRRMVYDRDALIAEYNASGTMLNRYIHGLGAGDDPMVRYSGSSVAFSNARILYKDYRGSVVFEADKDGNNRVHTPYDEYGVHGSTTPQRFGYTGQAYVPEIGLYYYKARMYSPGLGRFMQTDPIGYADGMNMYAYVGNDPVNFVDPTGLGSCKPGTLCVNPPKCGAGEVLILRDGHPATCGSATDLRSSPLPTLTGFFDVFGGGGGAGLNLPSKEEICAALFAPDGQASGAAEFGAAGSFNIPVIGGATANGGLVADGAGNVGLILEVGKAFGVGFGGQVGGRVGVSTASDITELRGPALAASVTTGAAVGGAVDVSVAPALDGSGDGVLSAGATVGLAAGFSASSAVTQTFVLPLFDLSDLVGC